MYCGPVTGRRDRNSPGGERAARAKRTAKAGGTAPKPRHSYYRASATGEGERSGAFLRVMPLN